MRRVSLGPSWPGRTLGPSLNRSAALMGFIPSQVCSRIGWDCISAIPGPRAVRAIYPTRLIFVGLIALALVGIVSEPEMASGSGVCGVRLLGLAPVCGPRPRLSLPRAAFLPWGLPLAGLADTQRRASARARPRLRIINPRPLPTNSARSSQSAHGLGRSFRTWSRCGGCHRSRAKPVGASPPASPALQRVEGTDAWLVRTFVRIRTLYEVLHRP